MNIRHRVTRRKRLEALDLCFGILDRQVCPVDGEALNMIVELHNDIALFNPLAGGGIDLRNASRDFRIKGRPFDRAGGPD